MKNEKLISVIKISLILMLVLASIIFSKMNIYDKSEIIITPTGEQNSMAEGNEIWINAVIVDGKNIDLNSVFDDGWIHKENKLGWNSYSKSNIKDTLIGIIPSGNNREIVFNSNKWQGTARITVDNQTKIIDFFNSSSDGNVYKLNCNGKINKKIFIIPIALFLLLILLCYQFYDKIMRCYYKTIEFGLTSIECKRILYIYTFIILFLVSFLFYGNYLNQTFSSETYAKYVAERGMGDNVNWLLYNDPRPILALYYKLLYDLNLNLTHFQSKTVGIAIIIQTITCFIGNYYIIKRIKKNNTISLYLYVMLILSSIIVWFNPLFTDNIQYSELIAMIFLGNLSAVTSAILISRSNKLVHKDFILSCILLIIPIYIYQSAIYFYVLYSMIFYFADYMNARKQNLEYNIYSNLLRRIGVYLVAFIFELFYFYVFAAKDAARGNLKNSNVLSNILQLPHSIFDDMVNTFGLYPKYFEIVTIMLICAVICYNILKSRQNKKKEIAITASATIIGPFIALFALGILESWIQPTSISGLPSLISASVFILAILFSYLTDNEKHMKYNKILIILIQIIILFAVVKGYRVSNIISENKIITNTVEQEDTKFYLDTIATYEKNTGNKITKIAFSKDENFTEKLGDTRYSPYRINERIYQRILNEKSEMSVFNYLGKYDLNRIDTPDDIYIKYFKGKNWNTLSNEQIICLDDTVYICLY